MSKIRSDISAECRAKEVGRIARAVLAMGDEDVRSRLLIMPDPRGTATDNNLYDYCSYVMRFGSHAGRLAVARIVERAAE